MKIERFAELWNQGHPGQQRFEWFLFLKFLSDFWEMNGVKNPIVVEIGTRRGRQKRFWHELGAIHLGVDISNKRGEPDIIGDSHNPITLRRIQERLKNWIPTGKCHLLFIDGDHSFLGVKQDFEMYGDLAEMIALHDIHCLRCDVQVNEFWMKLRKDSAKMEKGFAFMEFFKPQPPDNYGIGLILKDI